MDKRFVITNGLRYCVRFFPAQQGRAQPDLLMGHGFLDSGASFEQTAQALAQQRDVYVIDWRGHGESDWISGGGYYHFADYVADLDGLPAALGIEDGFDLFGHSMGGVVSSYFAGTRPERIRKLVLAEGFGPPDAAIDSSVDRMRGWLEGLRKDVRTKAAEKDLGTLEEAAQRLGRIHSWMNEEQSLRFAEGLTCVENGARRWRYDPLHRTMGPYLFRVEVFARFCGAVKAPLLLVEGAISNFVSDRNYVNSRYALLPRHEMASIAAAGHMMHMQNPLGLAEAVDAFLAS